MIFTRYTTVIAVSLIGFQAVGQFSEPNLICKSSFNRIYDVAYGDLDGDGIEDVVVISRFTDEVALFPGEGNGDFASQIQITNAIPEPTRMAIGDNDYDGDIDLIIGSKSEERIYRIENLGNGNFATPQMIIQLDEEPASLTLERLDGDTIPDLLIGTWFYTSNMKVGWMAGDGTGQYGPFQAVWSTGIGSTQSVTAGDIDGDGDNDLLWTSGNTLATKTNDGVGNFANAGLVHYQAGHVHSELVDLDNDNDLDILHLLDSSNVDGKVLWYENDGTGTYGPSILINDSISDPVWITAIDLNNDDLPEVFFSGMNSQFYYMWNYGNGNFGPRIRLASNAGNPYTIRGYDHGNNGFMDVIFSSSDDRPGIYKNNSGVLSTHPEFLSTTVSGSGKVEILDVDYNGSLDIMAAGTWFEYDGTDNCRPSNWVREDLNSLDVMRIADFDGDGFDDVAYISQSSNEVVWQRNNGNGVFDQAIQVLTFQSSLQSLEASDIDNDNDIDLAYSVNSGSSFRIGMLVNDGSGNFSDQLIDISGGWPSNIQFHDMDGDSDLDMLVSASSLSPLLKWYEASGPGDFSSGVQNMIIPAIGGYQVMRYAVGDMDGDLDLDVVASLKENTASHYWLYSNIGNGIFGAPEFLLTVNSSGSGSGELLVEDLDGDQDLDIISSITGLDEVVWWQNSGNGTYSDTLILFDQIEGPSRLSLGDLDNDLDLDLVISSSILQGLYWAESNINISTHYEEIQAEAFTVYPNPFSNTLNIQFINEQKGVYQIEIYNGTGKLIHVAHDLTAQNHAVDLNEEPSGIYMVRITKGQQITLSKIIVLAR